MRGSPRQVAEEIKRRAAALGPALRAAEAETLQAAQAEAKRMSQGGYKQAQLTAMGHPYSKRDPRPPLDPEIVNNQDGDLYRGWRRRTGNWSGGTLFSYVFNISAHAALVEAGGSTKSAMIARPLVARVQRAIRQARLRRLRAAARRVL